jgi:hypothetical protein
MVMEFVNGRPGESDPSQLTPDLEDRFVSCGRYGETNGSGLN